MIRLTNPLIHDGRVCPAGEMIILDEEFERAIVAAGNAEQVGPSEAGAALPEPEPDGETPEEREPQEESEDLEIRLGRPGHGGF